MPEPSRADRILKPLYAAAVMGAVVALSLIWTGKGIQVSGIFSMLCPAGSQMPAAGATSCSIQVGADKHWIAWMAVGIFAGAAVTSFWRTRGVRTLPELLGVSPTLILIGLGVACLLGWKVGNLVEARSRDAE